MNRRGALALFALFLAGTATAVALAGTATTGTVSACATSPAQTIADNGVPIVTVPEVAACNTVTYTVPTATVTAAGTTTAATTTAATTTTPVPTSTGGTPGVGVLDESGHLGNIATPDLFSLMIGGAWGTDVSVIEKAAGRGLVYFDGTDVRSSFSTGVTYTQASANGWLLKNSSGGLLYNSTYGSYCADVGSAAYQQAWIANVETYLAAHPGVDGIFIDNVLYDPKADCGAYPAKYPTTTAWDAATVSFVQAVHAALHPLGYYVALNAGAYKSGDSSFNDGTSTVNWWHQVGPYGDGLMSENYDQTSQGLRTSAVAWTGYFDGWQRLIGTAQGMGDNFVGLTYGSATNTTSMTYGKASFLLEWDGGGGAFIYKLSGSTSDPTNPAWTTSIGTPVAAKVAVGVGYERAYTAGTVLVNPSATNSQTFTVAGASYTLAATSARILP